MKKNFNEIIARARETRHELANRQTENGVPFTKANLIHVYGHLELVMALAAAQSDAERLKALALLQAYTTVSELAGKEYELVMAEMQGERIHLVFETNNPPSCRDWIIEFARVWNAGINAVVKPKAGSAFESFYMAADWGTTLVLLSTGSDNSESIICLGNAANRPAKHLGRWRGNKNGHLRLNEAAFRGDDGPAEWKDHDVSEPPTFLRQPESTRILNRVTESSDPMAKQYLTLSAKEVVPVANTPVTAPQRRRGFVLRADLDGFSKRVQAAMAGSDEVQQALVDEFDRIMKEYPAALASELKDDQLSIFPWSGDCANFVIEPDPKVGFGPARTYMPARVAHAWHKISRQPRHRLWSAEPHRWAAAVIGGDGYILMARVHTSHRTFAVAAGWPWGRSIDAYQADDVVADDTVIAKEDYSELDERYREPFAELDTRFHRSSFDALDRAMRDIRRQPARSKSESICVGAAVEALPRQRPYGGRK